MIHQILVGPLSVSTRFDDTVDTYSHSVWGLFTALNGGYWSVYIRDHEDWLSEGGRLLLSKTSKISLIIITSVFLIQA